MLGTVRVNTGETAGQLTGLDLERNPGIADSRNHELITRTYEKVKKNTRWPSDLWDMITNHTFFTILLLLGLISFDIQAQHFEDLDWSAADPKQAWNYMRTPPSNGPVVLSDGTKALYLSGPFSDYGSGAVNQTIACDFAELQQFKVSAEIKTKNVIGSGATIYAYGKVGADLRGYVTSGNLSGDNNWQTVSVTFVGDNRMDSIRLGCYLEGEGEAWFKNLSWEKIEPSQAPVGDSVMTYLNTFFQIVETNVINADELDFNSLRCDAEMLLAGAQSTSDIHDELNYLARRINKHSFVISPSVAREWMGIDNMDESEESNTPQEIEEATGRRIDDQIAYLTVPQIGSLHEPTKTYYADTLQRLIKKLDTKNTNGWIIDLRANGGGNCWPMLAGIGPLIGEGTTGYFIAPDGSNPQAWIYRDGVSYQDSIVSTSLSQPPYKLKNKKSKIAVLYGPATASSGEVVATAFRGRDNSRSFGQPSAGYASTNENYNLPDGAILFLTVSMYADRNKQLVPMQLLPDEIVEPQEEGDAALEAAIKWLKQ